MIFVMFIKKSTEMTLSKLEKRVKDREAAQDEENDLINLNDPMEGPSARYEFRPRQMSTPRAPSPHPHKEEIVTKYVRAKDARGKPFPWGEYDATKWPLQGQYTRPQGDPRGHNVVPLVHQKNEEPQWHREKEPPEWFPHDEQYRKQVIFSPTSQQIGNWKGVTSSFKKAYLARGHDTHRDNLIDIYQHMPDRDDVSQHGSDQDDEDPDDDEGPDAEGEIVEYRPRSPSPGRTLKSARQKAAISMLSGRKAEAPTRHTDVRVDFKMSLADVCAALPKRDLGDSTLSRHISRYCALDLIDGQTLKDLADSEDRVGLFDDVQCKMDELVPKVNEGKVSLIQAYSLLTDVGADEGQVERFIAQINIQDKPQLLLDYAQAPGIEAKIAVMKRHSDVNSMRKMIRKMSKEAQPQRQQKESKNGEQGKRAPQPPARRSERIRQRQQMPMQVPRGPLPGIGKNQSLLGPQAPPFVPRERPFQRSRLDMSQFREQFKSRPQQPRPQGSGSRQSSQGNQLRVGNQRSGPPPVPKEEWDKLSPQQKEDIIFQAAHRNINQGKELTNAQKRVLEKRGQSIPK